MSGLIGQNFGRYQILELLGEGGMATVYKAYDTRLEREVAIKVIRRDAFPPDDMEMMLKRFEREAKSLGRLSHPNIRRYTQRTAWKTHALAGSYTPASSHRVRFGLCP